MPIDATREKRNLVDHRHGGSAGIRVGIRDRGRLVSEMTSLERRLTELLFAREYRDENIQTIRRLAVIAIENNGDSI